MCLGVYNCLMYYARNIRSMKKCCDIYIYIYYIDYTIYINIYIMYLRMMCVFYIGTADAA